MTSVGSVSIQLKLDRASFDSDLQKLSQQNAPSLRVNLDTKGFEQQIKGLRKLATPILIPLQIDSANFSQQLKKLSASIDPIKVDLAPNVKDFQEKLRRLSKISPIEVEIKTDGAKVKQQFETIGRYAAEGFAQGFAGAEDAGKSAIDSMVRSVNKQLGIQSPSKVFRQIGKYAADGLAQGLESVETGRIVAKINADFAGLKLKTSVTLNPDIEDFEKKLSSLSGTTVDVKLAGSSNPGDATTKSIEEGFKKAKPKTSFLGSIFGGIGSLITAPLAGAFRGAFEGVGTPIGRQVGSGVAKAIQSTLGSEIGSLELISQKAVEKSLQAIPKATESIVGTIKANPIGNAVVKQLESLRKTLELYSINLSPSSAVKSLTTSQERAAASGSATFTSQEQEFKSKKQARVSAANEFINLSGQQENVQEIAKLVKQKEEELVKKQKKLEIASSAIASLEVQLQKVADLPLAQQASAAAPIKTKIAEFSEVLAGGVASIEQDIKDIASLREDGRAYFEKLNNQIKVLADLGIEKDLSSQSAEILKGIDVFEQMASAQKALQKAQKNVKINAKTPEAIRGKKLEKLTGLATSAKTELEQAIASPDASPEQIQKLQKRAAAANKALDLYKLEISDPAKEIEKLNEKLASGNAALAKNIQELQTRLTQAIPALLRDATQEVVKVSNLNEISRPAPSKGQVAIERQALASEQEARKALELKKLKQQKADSTKNLPKLYVDAVQSVSRIVTGQNLEREKIPNIIPSTEVAGKGDYSAQTNTYRIRPDLYKQLETGDITQVADEAIGNIVHEIFHAFQHNFGKAIADNTGQLAVDIVPTPEELLEVGDKVESSVAIQPPERKSLSRQLETGANVFQLRNTEVVKEDLKRNSLKDKALSLGGIAGSKIGLTDVNKLIDNVSDFLAEAQRLGIDVSKQKSKYIGLIKDIRTKADEVGIKSVNIDNLPTIEIEEIVKQYQEILKTVDNAKAEVLELTQSLPQTQAFKQELLIQNQKPELAKAAKGLGIKGVSTKNKEELADAIIGTGLPPETIRAKLPSRDIGFEKIMASVQKLLQMPIEEIEKSTKYAVNSFSLKLKSIAKAPNDNNKLQELQSVLSEIEELEKTYIATSVNTLDEGLRKTLQGRILGLQKQRTAATYQLKPLIGKSSSEQSSQLSLNQPIRDAEISQGRKNLDDSLPAPPPPPWQQSRALVPYESKLPARQTISKQTTDLVPVPAKPLFSIPPSPKTSNKSVLPTPLSPAQVDPKFGLPIKLRELFDKVIDAGDLLKIVSDIQKDQTKSLDQKLAEYDQIIQIHEDLQKELELQNQQLDAQFSPENIDRQREEIKQRAKLSANLERKHGLEGLAPEILPDRINDLGEITPSPSIFQGIKDIFKSLDNSIAKRVKKRAAQLAIEVDTAIAPSLETSAIVAGSRGDKVEQRQYEKLAKQSRAATKGIAKILESPGDLTEKQVKQLDRLTSSLEKVYDAIGRPLPSQGFFESIGVGAGGAIGLVKNLGGVIKGFLAFQIGMWAQNFFGSIAQESFKAYVELDRLKTALNFASGGSSGGAQNLAFVKKTVDDLGVPLKSSTQGFVGLAAAARGTVLEGKETRELFQGLSEASTVLGLSAEDTQGAMLALEQMISKGKIGADDYRQQLGQRLPGAMGLLARAAGVTEAELSRLMESGQAITQDLFPKLSRQLHAEYGEGAKTAGNNAQSSIFRVQNSFLELQQGIGEGVAPAAIAGLNALSVVLQGVAKVGKELAFIIGAVSVALAVKMSGALLTVINELILTKAAGASLGGTFSALGRTINNSFSAQLATGIFGVLEIVNLLNQAVNTDLVKSFDEAAKASKRAGDEAIKALNPPTSKNSSQGTDSAPEASSGVGRFLDKYVIGAINATGGNKYTGEKITTYGELEKNNLINSLDEGHQGSVELISALRMQIAELKSGKGNTAQLPIIDKQLTDAQAQSQILQARIKRDYTDKGLATPADLKLQSDSQNQQITKLTDRRADIANPFTSNITKAEQDINRVKVVIDQLKSPEAIKLFGSEAEIQQQLKQKETLLEALKQVKSKAEATAASFHVDPVRAFTQALRELNLVLAEGSEKNKDNLQQRKLANSRKAIAGFSTNKLATRQLAFDNADDEYKAAQIDEANSSTAVKTYEDAANKPDFQSTLQRLGLTPDASVSKIDDILKNSTDESDKGILEKLKAGREAKAKYKETQQATVDAREKRRQVVQDNALFRIDDSAADAHSATQKAENAKITAVKNAQTARTITEEVANEKIARIQLNTTKSQQKNLDSQLSLLRTYYNQGAISAEKFAEKRRDLETAQTELEKQQAENRLAVQSATLQRRIKEVEIANKQAELTIGINQTQSGTAIKNSLLQSGITISGKDSADLEQNKIDQKAVSDRADLIKERIVQNQKYYKEGLQNARETKTQEMALNLELAQNHQQTIELKIAAEEKYRAIIERNISTRRTITNTAIDKRLLVAGLTPQAQDQAAIDKNKADQKEVEDKFKFIMSRVKSEKEAKDEIAAFDSQLTKLRIEGEEKRRESTEHAIQRVMQAEENRFKKQTSQLDESKAKLDLYNQSLERTNRLEESRRNLSKAVNDAKISGLEDKKNNADDAQSLVDKLKDKSTSASEKAAIKDRLNKMGYGPQSGVTTTPATVTTASSGDSPEDYELQIKESKYSIEQDIANLKQKSMEEEQAFQKKSLEYDLKRLKIAAQTALYDAQGEELAAEKAKMEADSALKIAIAKKDPTAIATAQTDVEIADKRVGLANKRVESAQENVNSQDETAANATQAQGVTQGAETQHFGAEETRRKNAASLDLYETGEKAKKPRSLETETWEDTVKRIGGGTLAPSNNYATDLNLQLKPGESIFDAYQRQRDEMKLPAKGMKLPGNSKVDIPPMDKTAASVQSTAIQPKETSGYSQFVMALKMANQGIEQRLDKLIDSMAVVVNSPRSVHVSSNNPIDDAADLLSKTQRAGMRAAGV